MSPVNPILVLPALLLVLLTVYGLNFLTRFRPAPVTYPAIDGLRGYLAFFVFLHHASLWYFYLHTGSWGEPPSRLFIHFGQTSVALFFMITAFLFFRKLVESGRRPVDWLQFYSGRILRLWPVYLLAMTCCLVIIMAISAPRFMFPGTSWLRGWLPWCLFGLAGRPPVNHTFLMDRITAGATWTLIYEWLFYAFLPLIGYLFFRSKVPVLLLLLSGIIVWVIVEFNVLAPIHFFSFGMGIVAAFATGREKRDPSLMVKRLLGLLAFTCLAADLYFFTSPYAILPITLIGVLFLIVARGNTLFGLLTTTVSRSLARISYPFYLLHPIALFVTMRILAGYGWVRSAGPLAYWSMIAVTGVALVIACLAVHVLLEKPFMKPRRRSLPAGIDPAARSS